MFELPTHEMNPQALPSVAATPPAWLGQQCLHIPHWASPLSSAHRHAAPRTTQGQAALDCLGDVRDPSIQWQKSGWCSCCSPSRVSEPYAEVSLPSAPGSPPWRGRGRRRSRFISTRSSSSWSYGSRTKRTEKEIDKFPEIFNIHGFLLWAVNKIDCLFLSNTKQTKNKKLSMSSSDNLVTDSSNWQVLQNLIIEKNLWLISKQISSTVVFLQTNSSNLPKMFQKKS